jgi:hypothetical protein
MGKYAPDRSVGRIKQQKERFTFVILRVTFVKCDGVEMKSRTLIAGVISSHKNIVMGVSVLRVNRPG